MIDITLLLASIISFLLFVFFLTICVRKVGQTGILSWMKRIFIVLFVIGCFVLWLHFKIFPLTTRIMLLTVYLFLYWALSFAYTLGLFGLPLTSLRIQLLITLVQSNRKNMKKEMLLRKYSRLIIVKQRLHRLETSGEIIRRGNRYLLRSPWTYFMIHTYFLILLMVLYRPFGSKKNYDI